MISNKTELLEYLEADRVALGRKNTKPSLTDLIYKFEINLRKYEFSINCCKGSFLGRVKCKYYYYRHFILSVLCGFSIPPNVFGKGLSIAHRGTIIVNSHSRIGDNCRLHACVNIGTVPGKADAAPIIGDNVYIAPGVKIYGPIHIASNIVIGANAVVNKNFVLENITIAGVPAKQISDKGRNEIDGLES